MDTTSQAQNAGAPAASQLFFQLPDTVSRGAREYLQSLVHPSVLPDAPAADDVAGWTQARMFFEHAQKPVVEAIRKRFQPTIRQRKLSGIKVLDVRPRNWQDNGKALVYLHGGAYTVYSAESSLTIATLVAEATGMRVFSVDYTLAPEAKWQRVTDEVLAVFRALSKQGFRAKDLVLFGDSAGGALAAGSTLKMLDKGRATPAALVLWSPWADITNSGDTAITLRDIEPTYLYDKHLQNAADAYADRADQRHPYVSPIYGDYSRGFPPVLIQGGTREIFLSHFVRFFQALDQAGCTVKLDLYDGMTHDFQRPLSDAPEGKTALTKMVSFINEHTGS